LKNTYYLRILTHSILAYAHAGSLVHAVSGPNSRMKNLWRSKSQISRS